MEYTFDAAERAEEPVALIYNTQDVRAITETPVEYNVIQQIQPSL